MDIVVHKNGGIIMKSCRLILMALTAFVAVPQQTKCSYEHIYKNLSQIVVNELAPVIIVLGACGACALAAYKAFPYLFPMGVLHKPGTIKETFNAIAGQESIKEEIQDVVDYLGNPTKYKDIGTKIPKGILMHGPPGTGKTSLARAMAGEVSCAFIALTGSELNRKNVYSSAELVKSLFRRARAYAPCIIFIDEIDSLDWEAQKQLLTEMDGFEVKKELVIVIGSTNNCNGLNSALLRPGRFDRVVKVDLPSLADRKKILAMYAGRVKIDTTVDLEIIAELTSGFSGADLANLINEASIITLRANKSCIDQKDLENALDKLTMGKPVKDKPMTKEERRMIAYHEAGHALVTVLLDNLCNPLHKVTIVAHGTTEGFTATVPQSSIGSSKEQLLAIITTAYGGRAAEQLVFNKLTTGAATDLHQASAIAHSMVYTYGMSEKLGLIIFQPYQQASGKNQQASGKIKQLIEEEIATWLAQCFDHAFKLLAENRDRIDLIDNALLEKETLSAKEVYALIGLKQNS